MRLSDVEAVAAESSDPRTWAQAWRVAHHVRRVELDLARGDVDLAALIAGEPGPVADAMREYLTFEANRRRAVLEQLRQRLEALEERDPDTTRDAVRWVVETGRSWVRIPGGSDKDG